MDAVMNQALGLGWVQDVCIHISNTATHKSRLGPAILSIVISIQTIKHHKNEHLGVPVIGD